MLCSVPGLNSGYLLGDWTAACSCQLRSVLARLYDTQRLFSRALGTGLSYFRGNLNCVCFTRAAFSSGTDCCGQEPGFGDRDRQLLNCRKNKVLSLEHSSDKLSSKSSNDLRARPYVMTLHSSIYTAGQARDQMDI